MRVKMESQERVPSAYSYMPAADARPDAVCERLSRPPSIPFSRLNRTTGPDVLPQGPIVEIFARKRFRISPSPSRKERSGQDDGTTSSSSVFKLFHAPARRNCTRCHELCRAAQRSRRRRVSSICLRPSRARERHPCAPYAPPRGRILASRPSETRRMWTSSKTWRKFARLRTDTDNLR